MASGDTSCLDINIQDESGTIDEMCDFVADTENEVECIKVHSLLHLTKLYYCSSVEENESESAVISVKFHHQRGTP